MGEGTQVSGGLSRLWQQPHWSAEPAEEASGNETESSAYECDVVCQQLYVHTCTYIFELMKL